MFCESLFPATITTVVRVHWCGQNIASRQFKSVTLAKLYGSEIDYLVQIVHIFQEQNLK